MAYQRILQLTYVDELLAALKTLFVKLFEPFLTTFVASLHAVTNGKLSSSYAETIATSWDFAKAFENWDSIFDKLLRGLEDKSAQVCASVCKPSLFSIYVTQDRRAHLAHAPRSDIDLSPPSDDLSTGT